MPLDAGVPVRVNAGEITQTNRLSRLTERQKGGGLNLCRMTST